MAAIDQIGVVLVALRTLRLKVPSEIRPSEEVRFFFLIVLW